jgi:hypothetical protein
VQRNLTLTLVLAMVTLLGAWEARAVTISLGNLFDDPVSTPLATAMATDTYGAAADAADLGVDLVRIGNVSGMQPIATAGGFSLSIPLTGTLSSGGIGNDSFQSGASQSGIRFSGSLLPTTGAGLFLQGIGMHANTLITFDLAELRAAAGLSPTASGSFISDVYGLNDTAGPAGDVQLWVIVSSVSAPIRAVCNGTTQTITSIGPGAYSTSGTCSVFSYSNRSASNLSVAIDGGARYLTLVGSQAGGTDIFSDHAAWGTPRLELIPEPSTGLLLGLGLLGLGATGRRGRPRSC